MNRSADQALRSLLPTHNGPFPPQLADLAGSLLAQSRHRASTIKADEEIARSYACAHIACDRLKTSLNLPPIEPRPPIQPRLYKRLYAYLNTVLKPASSAANNRAEGSLASPANRATPSKANATNTNTPSKLGTPSRTPSRMPVAKAFMNLPPPPKPAAGSFPPWLRPTVRFVCHELGYPILAPTIMAGLAVIHREVEDEAKSKRPKGSRPQEEEDEDEDEDEDMTEWLEENLTSLVAALYLYSVTSWRGVLRERQAQKEGGADAGGQDAGLAERQFQLDEKAILGVFDRVRSVVGKGGSGSSSKPIGDEAWFGWQDLQRRTFRDALVVVLGLVQERLQALDSIDNALLERDPLDSEELLRLLVVVLEVLLGAQATGGASWRQPVGVLREVLLQNLEHLLVVKEAFCRKQPVAAELGLLQTSQDVRLGNVTHVHPDQGDARLGDLGVLLPHARQRMDNALVARVDARQALQVVRNRAQHGRRVDRGQVKVGLLVLDKVPCGLLGQRLAGAVAGARVLLGVLDRHRVPRLLSVQGARLLPVVIIEDGGKRRRDDDAADLRGILLDALEDARGANDGRVDEVLDGVGHAVVEGRGSVQDNLDAGDLDRLVERVGLRELGNNLDLETVLAQLGVSLVDVGGLGLAADGGDNGVALGEELLDDVGGNEARAT
ncbi:origin recognition complex subunit 6 [Ophiostoma piceae UAMH 11346]|uniref:Origin recognition complex subunit 6 n=1 Tax=Ophiostoma piceae (strain UAMH 11346) TaxID=1262450 RepID=S3C710_OPHP1|nr:origin recognition complex subunit 6 [Ophiostoma piceae UAMH 11346]